MVLRAFNPAKASQKQANQAYRVAQTKRYEDECGAYLNLLTAVVELWVLDLRHGDRGALRDLRWAAKEPGGNLVFAAVCRDDVSGHDVARAIAKRAGVSL